MRDVDSEVQFILGTFSFLVWGGLVMWMCAGFTMLERLRIDDEVGAIPAHMGAGVWGTMAVCIAAGGDPLVQLTGVVVIGGTVFGTSLFV